MKLGSMRHMGFDQALLPKRMAVVSHSHPSLSKGGAEISAYALYRGLREIGIDAIYIGACAESDRGKLSLGSDSEFALFRDAARYDHFYHLAPLGVEDDLLAILAEQRIGLVNFHHFYNIGLNSLRAAQRLPDMLTFLTIHEFLAICHNHGQMVTRPAQILCERARAEDCLSCFPAESRSRFALRKETMLDGFGAFDGFVSPSRFLAERFIEWGLGADRTTVIENGLLSPPEASRGERGEGAWVFGFFGQITPFKGVDVILDAADLIAKDAELARKVRLRIHGNLVGQSQGFTERFEAALKAYPFLTYAGAYNNASVHRLMSECDYLVIPSKWWENSPVVIQEAYSVGLPVICTGIGGMAEKVPDGVSGLHFRLGDASDLLRTIKLGADRRNHETLRRGIPHVSSARDMAERYLAFFATMAATRLVETP